MSPTRRFASAAATLLGCGHAPIAPGTVGSFVAALIYLPMRSLFWGASWWIGATLIVLVTLLGVWSAGVVETVTGKKDPGRVVIDEVAGQWLTYLTLPFSWPLWILGFFLFRIFDIIKPFPARRMERLPGGWGIMTDDLFAGLYALLVLHAIHRWILS